jgi:hypothetical protein
MPLRLEKASGQSPLHDVKDAGRLANEHPQNLALGKRLDCADAHCRAQVGRRPVAHNRVGGARRDRTDDLLLAKQALSQLSYGPGRKRSIGCYRLIMVGLGRLELPTSRLSGVRSNHLSYRPDAKRTFSDENASSCLKKEKRRRRNPALSLDPVRFLRPVRCLGRADMASVRAHP